MQLMVMNTCLSVIPLNLIDSVKLRKTSLDSAGIGQWRRQKFFSVFNSQILTDDITTIQKTSIAD